MTGSALWYAARGTGVVSLLLLTLIVVLGVATRHGASTVRTPRFVVAALHRNAALLAVVFLAIHVATAVIDPYAPIRWLDAVLPFVSAYRPLWLGLGAVSLDLVAALVVTSLLRTRIGPRVWRSVHWLAYAAWPVAVLHSLGTGTDARQPWLLGLTAGCVVAVAGAVLTRAAATTAASAGARAGSALLAGLVPLGLAGWVVAGPLQPGWASRAGTPAGLVRSSTAGIGASVADATTVPRGTFALSGGITQRSLSTGAIEVVLDGSMSGGGRLVVTLDGQPLADGGVTLTSGRTAVVMAAQRYAGTVTGLDGGRINASLVGPGGRLSLAAALNVDAASGAFTGTVTLA